MPLKLILCSVVLGLLIAGGSEVSGQKRGGKRTAIEKPPVVVAEKADSKEPEQQADPRPVKRNSRTSEPSRDQEKPQKKISFTHEYEFTQPEFSVTRLVIRHDGSGAGDITFAKKGSDETITDPVQLSAATLGRIAAALEELDFLNSTEDYQYERDYSHLGNLKFTLKDAGRSRTVTYNWTDNKAAKALMDEYRRLGQQYVWMFDVSVARSNQPLEVPKLMVTFDGYFRRGEVSDPEQMLPFLRELSDDERVPLIGRNHAAKLVKQIEKQSEKANK